VDAIVGRDRWRRVPVIGLAIVAVAIAMTVSSVWDAIDIARGMSGADRVRVVLLSLQSEACLVAIIGLLLVRVTELSGTQSPDVSRRLALTVGRVLGALFVIGGVAAATDAITRDSSQFPFAPYRGPAVLTELALTALGIVVFQLGSWPARSRPRTVRSTSTEVSPDD
jgi:hypothetical protein